MRLAIVQTEPRLGDISGNLERVRTQLQGFAFDVLVLPELFATGYYFHDSQQVAELAEPVPGGFTTRFLIDLARERGAVLVGPEGLIGVYRKLHLFNEESRWFTPGDREPEVYNLPGVTVGIMICYDWRYPEVARILTLKGVQLLLHPANLVQPYCQEAMITRCLENRVFAATANRIGTDTQPSGKSLTFTGQSQVVTPGGNLLSRGSVDESWSQVIEIEPAEADNKSITDANHLLKDRRPELYHSLLRG